MRGTELLSRTAPLASRELPSHEHIARATRRIRERWPHVTPRPQDDDREALAMEMLVRVRKWEWERCKKRRVTTAAFAVFDAERRDRPDLAPVRSFYLDEVLATNDRDFLGDMLQVYLECFEAGAKPTTLLSEALRARSGDHSGKTPETPVQAPSLRCSRGAKGLRTSNDADPESLQTAPQGGH